MPYRDVAVLPRVVYVPAIEVFPLGEPTVALARDLTGSAELFCYTSPGLLRRQHGQDIPWLRLRRDEVERLLATDTVDRLRLDSVAAPVPEQRGCGSSQQA